MQMLKERTSKIIVVWILLLAVALPASAMAEPVLPAPRALSTASSGWQVVASPSTASMYALDMVDASEGWAGGMAGFMFHYNGTEWQSNPTIFDSVINAIDMIDASSGWGVTWQGEMIRYSGSAWTIHSAPASAALSDITMLDAHTGWAVGGIGADNRGTILRYDWTSGNWVSVSSPVATWLKGIDMVDANDGWIVGVSGTFLHWDGNTWTGAAVHPGILLNDVDAVASDHVWAVGSEGMIFFWDGSGWEQVTSPTTSNLNAISMIDQNEGWAVGDAGTIIHYQNGSWELVESPTDQSLTTVQMLGPLSGWAMGRSGTILHYTYVATPDLSTSTKSVDQRYVPSPQQLDYRITIRNSGDASATSVVVTDTIPANTSYVDDSASTTQGTIVGTNPLVVDVGEVAAGGAVTITFQVDLQDMGTPCWFVSNQAQIGAEGIEMTRNALTTVGTCYTTYLPVTLRSYSNPGILPD
ncbi:MAG: DUF11 domain-containing protein [Anaerolineae bacterium]|nr:DUF11 domain-containing protein [Anaerolineae bacterium]